MTKQIEIKALVDLVRDLESPLDDDTTAHFVEQARAAIAKATGGEAME